MEDKIFCSNKTHQFDFSSLDGSTALRHPINKDHKPFGSASKRWTFAEYSSLRAEHWVVLNTSVPKTTVAHGFCLLPKNHSPLAGRWNRPLRGRKTVEAQLKNSVGLYSAPIFYEDEGVRILYELVRPSMCKKVVYRDLESRSILGPAIGWTWIRYPHTATASRSRHSLSIQVSQVRVAVAWSTLCPLPDTRGSA